jgi:dihydrofolate reductase
MAKLIYSTITSLDGYVADEDGNFDWAVPDEDVHSFVNDLERPVGTYLYGRRMYEVMVYWETALTLADQPPAIQDFAQIWQAADKVVYSNTLETVSSARTRIERDFEPEAVRRMKARAVRDLTVGGPDLAAQAIKAGLVDEYPTTSAWGSNCWTNAVSTAVWFTSTTARGREGTGDAAGCQVAEHSGAAEPGEAVMPPRSGGGLRSMMGVPGIEPGTSRV